jgi:nucleotide-binding universal stress UspA family protein
MKKIIAAFDGLKFSESTKEYSIYFAQLTGAHLVGVFLDDITYTSYKIYDLIAKKGVSEKRLKQYEEKDRATRDKAVTNFEKACQTARLNYSIHRDRNVAIQELLHESIYTDLLIIDSRETLTHYDENLPTRFIRNLLSDVQCPVLLVPRKYKPIEKIILLYDGEPSSVFALKMFSYMLSAAVNTETEVVSVNNPDQTLHVPDNKLMKEFMKRHYPEASYNVLKGLPEVEITGHLKKQTKNILVVLGAYRRGMVSRWFRTSMADILMKELNAPLFIAHNK